MSMRDKIEKSKTVANQTLQEREMEIMKVTRLDVTQLSPKITGHERYEELITVIQEATARNITAAELEANIQALGDEAWQLAKDILKAIR